MNQTDYLNQKKKKKKKARRLTWLAVILLFLAAAGIFYYQKQQSEAEENPNAEEAVVLEADQSWCYLQIDSIEGNEMQAVEVAQNGREYAPVGDGAAATYMIPVGTDVVTRLGSVTTFSRLAAGDVLHCLMEQVEGEPVIVKIWIAG